MRTEFVLAGHQADETNWRERPALAKTGCVLRVADVAAEYGFTDIDGRQVPPFELDPA